MRWTDGSLPRGVARRNNGPHFRKSLEPAIGDDYHRQRGAAKQRRAEGSRHHTLDDPDFRHTLNDNLPEIPRGPIVTHRRERDSAVDEDNYRE